WHREGTRYGIKQNEADGLLASGEPGVQLTWMDAKVGDWVVTPRIGKPVEINALWYNALGALATFAPPLGRPAGRGAGGPGRPQEPRARPPAVPGPLRRRSAPARRRLPPGHGLGVAPRSVRARALQGPPRREGGARVPGAARAPPRRLRRRLHRRDLRRRFTVRARGLHRAGVECRRDAARLARARCGARGLRCVRYPGGPA